MIALQTFDFPAVLAIMESKRKENDDGADMV
jgi:hypothetical protein